MLHFGLRKCVLLRLIKKSDVAHSISALLGDRSYNYRIGFSCKSYRSRLVTRMSVEWACCGVISVRLPQQFSAVLSASRGGGEGEDAGTTSQGPAAQKGWWGPNVLRIVLSFSVASGVVFAAFAAIGHLAYDALCFSLCRYALSGRPKKNFTGGPNPLSGDLGLLSEALLLRARQKERTKGNMD